MAMRSSAELTRARAARRVVAILLVVAGLAACAMAALHVTGGVLGPVRQLVTLLFLLLGPYPDLDAADDAAPAGLREAAA